MTLNTVVYMTETPSENLLGFLDLLDRFGGENVRTRTLTGKGLTRHQLRYRQDELEPDYITVERINTDERGEEERVWSITARGEYVLDRYRQQNGRPTTDDEAKPADLTQGELNRILARLDTLEKQVANQH